MPLISRFEDIHARQEARKLVKMIYLLSDQGAVAKDFGLRDQMRRAAVSVMTNITEGFDCDSNIEFARFLGIARRSAVEVQSLLYAALDVSYITDAQFREHYERSQKTKALIGGFKQALKKRS